MFALRNYELHEKEISVNLDLIVYLGTYNKSTLKMVKKKKKYGKN